MLNKELSLFLCFENILNPKYLEYQFKTFMIEIDLNL